MAKPISTTITVTDHASGVLQKISKNLGKCISGFMRLNQVSSNPINVTACSDCEIILRSIDENVVKITQSLNQASEAAEEVETNIREVNTGSDKLLSTVRRIAGAYLTMSAAGKVIETSDQIASAKQRLSLVLREGETIEEMNKKIMASANRARGSYTDTFNQVSKLATNAGSQFANSDQIVKFVEQFNKLGALSGASVYESSQAMYQLTQSMAKGRLDGDELRSVMEGMPLVAKSIADYLGTDIGTMKEMAAEGLVTAEVVKNALLGSAVETDAKFQEMPRTWAQALEVFKNNAIQAFEPVLSKINELASNQKVQGFINGVTNSVGIAANAVMLLIDGIGNMFSGIYDKWSNVSTILTIFVSVLGVYAAILGAIQIAHMAEATWLAISTAAKVVATTATALLTKATWSQAAAQYGLNAALAACPLVWILVIIVAVIAAIYGIVAAINKITGSTISATGIIFGAIAWLASVIWNTVIGVINGLIQSIWTNFIEPWIGIIEWVLNVFNGGFNSFGDAVKNLLGNIISWFLSLGKVVTKIIDAIFGTNWTSGLESLQSEVLSWGKNENAITLSREAPDLGDIGINRWASSDAWNAGYNLGEGLENKVGDMFNFSPYTAELSGYDEGLLNSVAGIEENTGATAKSVDISAEDLKYLRDIAEMEAINRFTTAEIKVDMTNNNNINNSMDLDGIVDHLATRVTEAMDAAAAGAY